MSDEKRDVAMMASMVASGLCAAAAQGYDANELANQAVDLALRIQDKVWGAPELLESKCICSVEQGQLMSHPQCEADQHKRTPHDAR